MGCRYLLVMRRMLRGKLKLETGLVSLTLSYSLSLYTPPPPWSGLEPTRAECGLRVDGHPHPQLEGLQGTPRSHAQHHAPKPHKYRQALWVLRKWVAPCWVVPLRIPWEHGTPAGECFGRCSAGDAGAVASRSSSGSSKFSQLSQMLMKMFSLSSRASSTRPVSKVPGWYRAVLQRRATSMPL